MSSRRVNAVKSRWEGAAVVLLQLVAELSAAVSGPPPVPKTVPVSPVSPWSIVWLLSLASVCGIIALMVVPVVKGGAAKVRKALDPVRRGVAADDVRFKQLKAVATYYHQGNSYQDAIDKGKKQYAHQQWNVSIGKLSSVVSEFRKANGKEPRAVGLETFLNSLEKKTMGRGDGLSDAQYVEARELFNQKSQNWKAIPNWDDWNEMLCVVKQKEKGFKFSFEFLMTTAFRCNIKPIKCSSANSARVLAVGDYRNHCHTTSVVPLVGLPAHGFMVLLANAFTHWTTHRFCWSRNLGVNFRVWPLLNKSLLLASPISVSA